MLWGPRRHCTVKMGSLLPGLLRQGNTAKLHTLSTADVTNVWSCSSTTTPPPPHPIYLEDVMRNSTVDNKFSLYVCYVKLLLILWENPHRNYICYSLLTTGNFVRKLTVNWSRNPPSVRNPKMLQCLYSPAVRLHPEPYESTQ